MTRRSHPRRVGLRGALLLVGALCLWSGSIFCQTLPEVSDREGETAGFEKGKERRAKKPSQLIEAGDRLRVKIYPEDEYIKGGEMEVSSEGTITLPLIGKVDVQGKQATEVEREIVKLLAQDYLVNPVVVVEVAERVVAKEKRSLSILGQVQKPGSYEFPSEGKLTLLQVISMAGGFTEVANAKNIKVIRRQKNGKTEVIRANAEAILAGKNPDIELEPDEVVHVGESFF